MDRERSERVDQDLGRRLRQVRESLGISQTAVAKELGVSKQLVSHWEHGRSALLARQLSEIAAVFRMEPVRLCECLFVGFIQQQSAPDLVDPPLRQVAAEAIDARHVPHLRARDVGDYIAKWGLPWPQQRVITTRVSDRAVSFEVSDRGMMPAVPEGSYVVADPDVDPQPGEIVLVLIGEPLLRRIEGLAARGRLQPPFVLRPDNPLFRERVVTDQDEYRFLGAVVERTVFGGL